MDETEKDIERNALMINLLTEALAGMSEAEFFDLERKCLRTVKVDLPAGWQPVMVGNSFGLEDLEYDLMAMMSLVIQVIVFNVESFFGEKNLASFLSRVNMSSQDA